MNSSARAPYPSLCQAVILVLIEFVAGSLPIWLGIRFLPFGRPYTAYGIYAIGALAVPLCVFLVIWYGFRQTGAPFSKVFPLGRPAHMIGLFAGVLGLQMALQDLRPANAGARLGDFLVILTVTVYAPVFEELLYRGLLLGGFSIRYGKVRALLLSSAFFALGHFYQGAGALVTAVFGLLFGWLYLESGSLVPGIGLHSILNMLVSLGVTNGTWRIPHWSAAPEYRALGLVLVGAALGVLYRARMEASLTISVNRLVRQALALLQRAGLERGSPAGLELLAQARRLFERALRLQADNVSALDLWALALYEQTRTSTGDTLNEMLGDALKRFEAAAQDRMRGVDHILNGWGTILFAQANLTTGDEATALLQAAKQKYVECLTRTPRFNTYNLACVCARLGEVEECESWLRESGEPGHQVSRVEMAGDPDLASIRTLRWFGELLQKPL